LICCSKWKKEIFHDFSKNFSCKNSSFRGWLAVGNLIPRSITGLMFSLSIEETSRLLPLIFENKFSTGSFFNCTSFVLNSFSKGIIRGTLKFLLQIYFFTLESSLALCERCNFLFSTFEMF